MRGLLLESLGRGFAWSGVLFIALFLLGVLIG